MDASTVLTPSSYPAKSVRFCADEPHVLFEITGFAEDADAKLEAQCPIRASVSSEGEPESRRGSRRGSVWTPFADTRRPRIIRGYTHDFACTGITTASYSDIGALVATVLAQQGWGDVCQDAISVEDCSGFGGSCTFRVEGDGCIPPVVALHSRCAAPGDAAEACTEDAARALSQAGLAPRRLAQGGDWFVEAWGGAAIVSSPREEPAVAEIPEIAALLARVHRMPTNWFHEWREQLRASVPALRMVPDGSHAWWYARRQKWMRVLSDEAICTWVEETSFAPVSPAAARIVTCHGDFHCANIVRGDEGLQCIDLECALASHAVQDLSWAFVIWLQDAEKKRLFVECYLRASELPSEASDVDAVLLDAEVGRLGMVFAPMFNLLPRASAKGTYIPLKEDSAQNRQALYDAFKTVISEVRGDPALHREVIEQGFIEFAEQHAAVMGLIEQ